MDGKQALGTSLTFEWLMATGLGKFMTQGLGTMVPLKLISAVHQVFLTSHLLGTQEDCTPGFPCAWVGTI